MDSHDLPLLGLTIGDPAGIGPEIAAKALLAPGLTDHLRLVLLGPDSERPPGLEDAPDDLSQVKGLAFRATSAVREPFELGLAQANCGAAALAALRAGTDLALAGEIDGLVTGPVCKLSLIHI